MPNTNYGFVILLIHTKEPAAVCQEWGQEVHKLLYILCFYKVMCLCFRH